MSFATFGHGGDRDLDPWRPNISLHEIRSAIDNCEFNVLYQPKVNTSSLQFVASEALIRWNHPVHGLLRLGTPLWVRAKIIRVLDNHRLLIYK